ncbi:hypothetical protein ABFU65_17020 [Xanthomonas campestris pv. raphani]|uniref:hypothetical protein n=1 Tax=Xanthomonas campestris TaxID=339 RepID=UPI002B23C657|nr:hypothetical protein [Xanthomonas campestris]MEA9656591.1 hypothetical protein [Xanthomonas campestris pv. raphani]MEA9673607.1 hypothetical protein [Xanthomonas campestris pv. raphani]MEA9897403.1 hypothetical protein [Xanthomonas campestris pv. raphani]
MSVGKARGVQTPPPAAERGASGRAIAPDAAVPSAVRKSAGALRVLARGVKAGIRRADGLQERRAFE